MSIDDKLKTIVQDVWDKDVKSVPEAIEEIKALFPAQGVCADCTYLIQNFSCDGCNNPRVPTELPDDMNIETFGCTLFKPKESE